MTTTELAEFIANIQTRNAGVTVALTPDGDGWRADCTRVLVNPANPSLVTERTHTTISRGMSRDAAHQAVWAAMLGAADERIIAWDY